MSAVLAPIEQSIAGVASQASGRQLDLFAQITGVYAAAGAPITNDTLYAALADSGQVDAESLGARTPIGVAGVMHSPVKRKIRWYQQTLRTLGLIKRVEGSRGVWELTEAAGRKLHKPRHGIRMLGFSTNLGLAIWGDCSDVFRGLDEPLHCIIGSPPYPLQVPRAYGNVTEQDYTDFICRTMERAIRSLAPGGCLALNIGQDVFLKGLPARSMYCERLLLALADRFGLSLHERLVWENPSRPPGPIQYASIKRVQLNATYEMIYILTNDPTRVRADNRRVLEAHTKRHQALMDQGGETRSTNYGDGAYRLRPGSFGGLTVGRIPRNILKRGHRCPDTDRYRRDAAALGLPPHGAIQPLSVASFLVAFLSEPGDLIADCFGGTFKTSMAAEKLGRRHIASELILEYVRASAERFRQCPGFRMHPLLASGFAR